MKPICKTSKTYRLVWFLLSSLLHICVPRQSKRLRSYLKLVSVSCEQNRHTKTDLERFYGGYAFPQHNDILARHVLKQYLRYLSALSSCQITSAFWHLTLKLDFIGESLLKGNSQESYPLTHHSTTCVHVRDGDGGSFTSKVSCVVLCQICVILIRLTI